MAFENITLEKYAVTKLKKLYDSCLEKCGSKTGNLLVDLISKTVNDRSMILKESSIPSRYIDSQTMDALMGPGLITGLKNSEDVTITARGILYIESLDNDQYVSALADAIQSKYLDVFSTSAPTPRNRIVLLTMVAMRCFSEKSAIDLRKSTGDTENWWSILQEVSDFMVKIGSVEESKSLKEYKPKSGTEDPASDVIRHSDKLPRQTDGIFSKSGKNQYWLDIARDDEIDLEKLAKIIRLALEDSLNKDNNAEYAKFCNRLCLFRGPDIDYSMSDSRYLSMEYDNIIRKAFEKASYLSIH